MREHPKLIGDRTTLAVMLALIDAGLDVSVPFGENCRYDLVIDRANRLTRVQCKTGRLRDGVVRFATASTYGDLPSPREARRDYLGQIDEFAVYCPGTGGVYLLPIEDVVTCAGAHLRVDPRGTASARTFATRRTTRSPGSSASRPRTAAKGISVRQQRHRDPRVTPEKHATGDRRRAEAIAYLVQGRVECLAIDAVEGQHELNRARILEVGDRDADKASVRGARDPGATRRGETSPDCEDLRCARRRLRQRVGAGRTREVPEPKPEDDRAPDTARGARRRRVTRSTSATTSASTDSCDHGERPRARCDPIEPRRRRPCTGRGSRLWASAYRWRPVARPSMATRASSGTSASRPTVVMPRERSFAAVTGPTPQSRSTSSGWRKASSPSRRYDEEPIGLRHTACHLGEELRPRDAHGDREANPLAYLRPQARSDLHGSTHAPLHPAHVEECLIDRDPFDDGRRVLKDAEDRLARLRVGRHPGRHDDGMWAQPPRGSSTHRRANAEGLRFVARRERDATSDDDGAPSQVRIVSLLNGREEHVEIGVQDRGATL